ncbi:hypothetical protein [Streptosporangium sp. NPDC002721]|uniref:hypothetical protein n=1 Tax=Streptosporangium sp. NPDC002721 TaxID=3366188 RepID=UPI00368A70D3
MTRSTPPSEPQWSGDMLDRPEMMDAFATQLRRRLSDQAEWLARIRRDAEAMWAANPPEGYGTFEAWWRQRWVAAPFDEIQALIEKAAAKTFQLEARYRRGRHEIPASRQAATKVRQEAALAPPHTNTASRSTQPRLAEPRAPAGDFLDLATRKDRSPNGRRSA